MLTIAVSAALAADPPPPDFRITYETMAVARVNPLGTQLKGSLHFRFRLVDAPTDSALFGDTWASAGPLLAVTPAWARGGVFAQVSPIALLRLTASYEGIRYFGSFDQVQGFPDPATANYSDSALDLGYARSSAGTLATLEGRVQAKVGPIAVRNTFSAIHIDVGLEDGDVAFYDQMMDALIPGKGWILQNDADLLATGGPWAIGARYTHLAPMHDGEAAQKRTAIDRVGPLISYKFKGKRGAKFDQPTLFLLSQWHVRHPYRTGQEVSQLVPYLGVGFSFMGDIKPWP